MIDTDFFKQDDKQPVALTIGGSDSGGGAGIQADLKTFQSLGVFGASAITCLTAQNPQGVIGLTTVTPEMVRKQIRAVCDSFPVRAAKTGMVYSAEIIRAVAQADVRQGIPVLVVDPVMFSKGGSRLFEDDALDAFCSDLLPQARLMTPNIAEAEALWNKSIDSVDDIKRAACDIGNRFDTACVITGGDLQGDDAIDFLYDEGEEYIFTATRIKDAHMHGSGCAFSAAITAFLANGELISDAVGKAKEFVYKAIETSVKIGNHQPLNFFQAGHLMTK